MDFVFDYKVRKKDFFNYYIGIY